VHGRAPEALDGCEPTEAASDHDDVPTELHPEILGPPRATG
jgi:hypothetical protein